MTTRPKTSLSKERLMSFFKAAYIDSQTLQLVGVSDYLTHLSFER
jgi:hypothetical protein